MPKKELSIRIPKIQKLSSGSFFARIRVDGVDIPITRATEDEVINEYVALKRGIKDAKKEAAKKDLHMTLSDAIDSYIASKSNILSPCTIRGYTIFKKHRFKGAMGLDVFSVTQERWQELCNQEATLCGAKTLKNAWGFISTVIYNATGKRFDVTLPQIVKNEHPFLDDSQIKIFISAVKNEKCAIPAMLALCSLRISEILALTWDDIDYEKRTIAVTGSVVLNKENKLVLKETNKNATSNRIVPILIPELEKKLQEQKNSGKYIVTNSANSIRYQINDICEVNGLPKVGIHGLRHSFASLSYYLGLSEKVSRSIGGWSDDKTMREIYTHIANKEIASAADRLRVFYENQEGDDPGEADKDAEILRLKQELAEMNIKYSALSEIMANAITLSK